MILGRADRIFDNYLKVQSSRIDSSDGLSAEDRKSRIGTLRANRRAQRQCCDSSYELFKNDKDDGFNGTFLDWLLANSDKIFALIMKIMALFGL